MVMFSQNASFIRILRAKARTVLDRAHAHQHNTTPKGNFEAVKYNIAPVISSLSFRCTMDELETKTTTAAAACLAMNECGQNVYNCVKEVCIFVTSLPSSRAQNRAECKTGIVRIVQEMKAMHAYCMYSNDNT